LYISPFFNTKVQTENANRDRKREREPVDGMKARTQVTAGGRWGRHPDGSSY
jgi:hypothetical protein